MKNTRQRAFCLRAGTRIASYLWIVALTTASTVGQVARAQSQAPASDLTHLTVPHWLDGLWRIQAGDDPSFALPNYDDSRWIEFDPRTSLNALSLPNKPEVVWYRQRIRVDPNQTGLALREQTLSRAFEIYVNGDLLMRSGSVAPFKAYSYEADRLRRIPDAAIATGTLLIALRVHIAKGEWSDSNPGLFATNLTLGQETTLYNEDWLNLIGNNFFKRLDSTLSIGLGFVALFLFIAQPRRIEYFYIVLLGLIRLAELPTQIALLFFNIPVGWQFVNACILVATPYAWTALYFAFVNQRIGPKFRIFLMFAGLFNGYSTLHDLVPQLTGNLGLLTNLPFIVLLSVVIPIVLAIHWRRGNKEAGILLIPALLFSFYIYANYALALLFSIPSWYEFAVRGLALLQRYPLGPFVLSTDSLSGIASTISLAIIMVLRSSTTSRREALLEGELEAARQVQQVILPEQIGAIAGFAIESVYQPAQQVGGDFFQILTTGDGGLLLVLGDVAGKGLPAAMLVSVLVGAIRATADYTHAPEELLASLNERLIGRSSGGFSTAIAAYIDCIGQVTIANAGHLFPYLDGREIELAGALPLGILSNARYETLRFQLAPGSRLTFYSDGVIEAQNARGELLGFERGKSMSTEPAADIVQTAKDFGQSDDITVVAITRQASLASVA